ncbi:MAG: hypothetical protein M3023_02730 [Pseudomonadota bacterium]|nr:hypothetical protein [Pseudomonadota bacterium]
MEPATSQAGVTPPATPISVAPNVSHVALWILLASTTICTLVYLAITVQGPWFSSAKTLRWTPGELSVTEGTAELRADGLAVRPNDPVHPVRIAISTSLRAGDYPVIAWETFGVPDDVEIAVLWQNEYEPGRVFNQRLDVESGRVQPTTLAQNKKWVGRIRGIALAVQGNFSAPMIVRRVTAKTMSPREVLADRIGEWLQFEPWNGSSINTLIGGADTQDLPMSFTFAVILMLAALIYFALSRWRPQWVGSRRPAVIGAMFLVAWFALDARWLWNFVRQVHVTAQLYAGKSWHERHLVADDRAVFAFIEKVRGKLPPPPARVFVVADDHYYRDRSAYHLYPYNVFFDPWKNTMPPASAVRSGDFLVVYQRRGVQFDAAQQRLRWDGGGPLSAELLLAEAGAAMFRIL